MSEPCYGIIADDLTGATDAAVPFAHAGFRTSVILDRRRFHVGQAQVIALTTNSRHDSPVTARGKMRAACDFLRRHGCTLLYKKMDSTVQGNIIAETAVARRLGQFASALICPANPNQGRVIERGVLYVRGEAYADLEKHFAAQGLEAHETIQSPLTLAKVARVLRAKFEFVLADARTNRELAVLVRAALNAPEPVLLAGSAGMAGQLAPLIGAPPRPRVPRDALTFRRRESQGPILILSGSRNAVTERQLGYFAEAYARPVIRLAEGADRVIGLALNRGPTAVRVPIYDEPESAVRRRLASLSPLIQEGRIGGLLLTGGDTALLVCQWLGAAGITLAGELMPGIAGGTLVGGVGNGLVVCTKPGGFGQEDSVVRAVRMLSEGYLVATTHQVHS